MKTILATLLLALPIASLAVPVDVGGVGLEVPSPRGFAPVTPEMKGLFSFQKSFVPPANVELVGFVAEADVPVALRGEIPPLARRFSLQTGKAILNAAVSSADFSKLREIIKTQNDEAIKKAEKAFPAIAEQINKGIAEHLKSPASISDMQLVPFKVHEEGERTLAYSAFGRFNVTDSAGKPFIHVSAMTITIVHVKGKIVFLYCFADEDGLEWSRDISREWVKAFVAANPSDLKSTAREALPAAASGFDWGQLGTRTLHGALIGLVIGLVWFGIKRMKK